LKKVEKKKKRENCQRDHKRLTQSIGGYEKFPLCLNPGQKLAYIRGILQIISLRRGFGL
jgi:hypothetical protein